MRIFKQFTFISVFLFAAIDAIADTLVEQYYGAGYVAQRPQYSDSSLFVNDTFFDGDDRWRTGSYQRSNFWQGGEFEFRLRTEYIAPETLESPAKKTDRPYAAIFELGIIRHVYIDDNDFTFGATLTSVNKDKTAENFQAWLHDMTSISGMRLTNFYVDEGLVPSFEIGWRKDVRTHYGYLVPFVEARYGLRHRVTTGFDMIFTSQDQWFLNREQTTGHLLGEPKLESLDNRWRFDYILGADVSLVKYDYFIDTSTSNVASEPTRYRFRSGFRLHNNNTTLFIGPAYLSPEFRGQYEGQWLQSLSIDIRF